jgi:hypothetical protein
MQNTDALDREYSNVDIRVRGDWLCIVPHLPGDGECDTCPTAT